MRTISNLQERLSIKPVPLSRSNEGSNSSDREEDRNISTAALSSIFYFFFFFSSKHHSQKSIIYYQENKTPSPLRKPSTKNQQPSTWETVHVLHARGALPARAAHAALTKSHVLIDFTARHPMSAASIYTVYQVGS
ncbi:uncharacterized protein RSE6_10239 [Rhynchosporium secalis]|uniref:Uncharacterized protein n=1 Tax=Rhynchosporium secalis TaxID=38038 RepID=A0A1E1MJW7_RHYSE|nr:uncharacterized protein RSE6_10239 [Rhynchosporium secalis]